MALGSLNVNLPRYVLERYAGTGQLGMFASLAYIGTSATIVINALGQSASARLARMFASGDHDSFSKLVWKFAAFGFLIGIIGVPLGLLVGRRLLSAIYRPEYATHLPVLLIMVCSASVGAVASFIGYGVTAARSFKGQTVIMGLAAIVTVVVSIWLVPGRGIMGAAVAVLLSSVAQATGFTFLLLRRMSFVRWDSRSNV